jgi:anhydro-N-acetylmuramic acid kinase
LVSELSQGRHPFDPSGHFAVQGRICEELISKWSSHPFLLRPPPKFLDGAAFTAEICPSSLLFARDKRLSARDVLCSANQFVVRNLQEAIHRFVPQSQSIDEVWVSGGGSWNGFLWKLLADGLAPIPVARTDEAGVPAEARRAIHAALLAFFTMENLPANIPVLSGAAHQRVLGQITPGSRENWDRWVCNLADCFELVSEQAA